MIKGRKKNCYKPYNKLIIKNYLEIIIYLLYIKKSNFILNFIQIFIILLSSIDAQR